MQQQEQQAQHHQIVMMEEEAYYLHPQSNEAQLNVGIGETFGGRGPH